MSVPSDFSCSLPSITSQDHCENTGEPHPSGVTAESDDFSELGGHRFDAKNILSSTAFATPEGLDGMRNSIATPNFNFTSILTDGSLPAAPQSSGCLPTPLIQRGRKNFITRFYQTQIGSPQMTSSIPEIPSTPPRIPTGSAETPVRSQSDRGGNETSSSGYTSAVYNPFEGFMLDSWHKNTFSPSVFAKVLSPSAEDSENEGGEFQWSIDHIAIINPTEFDHQSHELCYEELSRVDPETEAKVQSAIDQYFAQPNVLPSPWSLENNRQRKLFSPAITDSPYRQNLILMKKVPLQHAGDAAKAARTIACQTALTIPIDLDLMQLLGDKFCYKEESDCDISAGSESHEVDSRKSEEINISLGSLRRKLFSASAERDNIQTDVIQEINQQVPVSHCALVFPVEPNNTTVLNNFSDLTPKKDMSGCSDDCLFEGAESQSSGHFDNISSSPYSMRRGQEEFFSPLRGRTSTSPEFHNALISPEISPIRDLVGNRKRSDHPSCKASLHFGVSEDANFSFVFNNDIVVRESPRSYVNLAAAAGIEGFNDEVSVGGNVDMRDCSESQSSNMS